MATPTERKKLSAEQYLAEHRIHWLMEHITSELVRFTPNDPQAFIIKRVHEILDAQEKAPKDHIISSTEIQYTRPHVIAVLGGPACGKAVQCAFLSEEAGMITVAPSELIRDEIKHGTEVGKQVGGMLQKNTMIPTDIVTQLLRSRIEKDPEIGPFALDGYPRTLEQALALEENVAEISLVIYLDCSENTMRTRMNERKELMSSGGGGGEDDTEPHQSEKIKFFNEETIPVIEYYKAMGKVVTIRADRPKADVMVEVGSIVKDL